MDFINRIGQRKFAKLLFGSSIAIALIGYVIRYFLNEKAGTPMSGVEFAIKTSLGVFLLSMSNFFLAQAAERTREYRVFCIFASSTILLVNTILFHLKINMLYITLGEIVVTGAFFVFVMKQEAKRKVEDKKTKRKVRTEETAEIEVEKE